MEKEKYPVDSIVVQLSNDGESSELCFKATIYSTKYEVGYKKPISWENIGLGRNEHSRIGGCWLSYIPGQSDEILSDYMVEWVDELFNQGVMVRLIEIDEDVMWLYVWYDEEIYRPDTGVLSRYKDLWFGVTEAFGDIATIEKHSCVTYLPKFNEGTRIIHF